MDLPRSFRMVLPVMLCLTGVLVTQSALAQISWVEAPEFAPPWTGYNPEFGDLDGDGDFDLIYAVVTQSYRNIGSPSLPSWQEDDSLVQGVDYEICMTTCLADLDADGDLDLSVGMLNGYPLYYYENIGSAAQPVWLRDGSMYESLSPGSWTCPELADLDDDGDLDLVLAVYRSLRGYRNTGTPETPSWIQDDSLVAGILPLLPQAYIDPNLGDLDGDGDLDLVIGGRDYGSPVMCYENSGSAQSPTWVENESMLTGVNTSAEGVGLDLADLDGDGDLDMLSCEAGNAWVVYLNHGSTTTPVEHSSWGRIKALFRQQRQQ